MKTLTIFNAYEKSRRRARSSPTNGTAWRQRDRFLAELILRIDQRDALAAKVKELEDNAEFVIGLREAETKTVSDALLILGRNQIAIERLMYERETAWQEVARLKETK